MRLLPFRIGMSHQGARFAQPKAPLPEQALALAHTMEDIQRASGANRQIARVRQELARSRKKFRPKVRPGRPNTWLRRAPGDFE